MKLNYGRFSYSPAPDSNHYQKALVYIMYLYLRVLYPNISQFSTILGTGTGSFPIPGVGGHGVLQPGEEVRHLGVDPGLVGAAAALAPAGHPHQPQPGAHQRAAAVPATRVAPLH